MIFTEALATTGLGHFTRCSALAEILIEIGHNASMVVFTDGIPLPAIDKATKLIKANWQNATVLQELLKSSPPSHIVIDSYLASPEIYATIAENSLTLTCIDDTQRIAYPKNATILHPGIGAKYVYDSDLQKRVIAGAEYVLLRKPFREKFPLPPIKESIQNVLITLGAEDRWNIIPQILQQMRVAFPEIIIHVLIGPGFQNKVEILANSNPMIKLHESLVASQIRDLMLTCDVAITAGGQTTYELARCGVPMILLQLAENQVPNILGWIHQGLIDEFCSEKENVLSFILMQLDKHRKVNGRQQRRLQYPEQIGKGTAYTALAS